MYEDVGFRSRFSALVSGHKTGPHFKLTGHDIAYTYIRKNGCSAYKKYIFRDVREGEFSQKISDYRKLKMVSGTLNLRKFCESKYRLFVYRDPFDRAVSLYLNKFVQQKGSEHLLRRYEAGTGKRAEEASFEDFIYEYVGNKFWFGKDPHVLPQTFSLIPAPYTHAIKLSNIFREMKLLIGEVEAEAYFRQPLNSTVGYSKLETKGAMLMNAADLRRIYLSSQILPTVASFVNTSLCEAIQNTYRIDYEMIEKVERFNCLNRKAR